MNYSLEVKLLCTVLLKQLLFYGNFCLNNASVAFQSHPLSTLCSKGTRRPSFSADVYAITKQLYLHCDPASERRQINDQRWWLTILRELAKTHFVWSEAGAGSNQDESSWQKPWECSIWKQSFIFFAYNLFFFCHKSVLVITISYFLSSLLWGSNYNTMLRSE